MMKDLEELQKEYVNQLYELYDTFKITQYALAFTSRSIDKLITPESLKLSLRFTQTNQPFSEGDYKKKVVEFGGKKFTAYLIVNLVTIAEEFLFDLILWLLENINPRPAFIKKEFDMERIFQADSLTSLKQELFEEEIEKLKYKKPGEWFVYLGKIINIKLPEEKIKKFAETKASRDLFIHNKSIVNSIYLDKSKERARADLGESIPFNSDYFFQSYKNIESLIKEIIASLIEKINKRNL